MYGTKRKTDLARPLKRCADYFRKVRGIFDNCDYSWNALKEIVPKALRSVELPSIRKYARKCDRYMDAYRENNGIQLTVAQVEHAVKKYRSHRSIPRSIMAEL